MKVAEITESKEHINLYWLLKSVNAAQYKTRFEKLQQLYIITSNINSINIIRFDLVTLYSHLDEFLRNIDWRHLQDDPDFDSVYDELLNLHDDINQFLSDIK